MVPCCSSNNSNIPQNPGEHAAASRIVTRTKTYDLITPMLLQFHCLQVQERVMFTITVLKTQH